MHAIKNRVGPMMANPPRPDTKSTPNRSKDIEVAKNETENNGMDHNRNL